MSKLPVISGHDAVRAFARIGYAVSHQTGSHIILRSVKPPHRHPSIANHSEIAKGTLRGLIRDAGITLEEFVLLIS